MHLLAYLIVPESSKVTLENLPNYINKVLDPFDQNKEVPKYTEPCFCLGREALEDARKAAEAHVGKNWEVLTMEFWADRGVESDADLEKYLSEWTLYTADYNNAALDTLKSHKLVNKPNKKCLECKGRGSIESTYNKNGKWSSYRYGQPYDNYGDSEENPWVEKLEDNVVLIETVLYGSHKLPVPDCVIYNNQFIEEETEDQIDYKLHEILHKNPKGFIIYLDLRRTP